MTGPSFWATTAAGAAVVAWGAYDMKRFIAERPERKPLLGMAGAFIFMTSLIPIPAYMGTCSHPCGTPLAGILLGPGISVALTALSLFLQALLFAHGGFATLGANTLTLGLIGASSAWLVFKAARAAHLPLWAAAGLAGLIGDLLVYVACGFILGGHLAFVAPQPQYSFAGYLQVIYLAYLPVQGPIALGEMFVTGLAVHAVGRQRPEVLESLGVIPWTAKKPLALLVLVLLPLLAAGPGAAVAEPADPPRPAQPAQPPQPAQPQQPPAAPAGPPAQEGKRYAGMDEKVNEALAEKAGARPREPYIDLEKLGDVWNTLLLLAGGICGFILGRSWHHLFGKPKPGA